MDGAPRKRDGSANRPVPVNPGGEGGTPGSNVEISFETTNPRDLHSVGLFETSPSISPATPCSNLPSSEKGQVGQP